MNISEQAVVDKCSNSDYTVVIFKPALSRFKMTTQLESLDTDTVSLLTKRAYDNIIAGCTKGVKVFLNGKRLPVSTLIT